MSIGTAVLPVWLLLLGSAPAKTEEKELKRALVPREKVLHSLFFFSIRSERQPMNSHTELNNSTSSSRRVCSFSWTWVPR